MSTETAKDTCGECGRNCACAPAAKESDESTRKESSDAKTEGDLEKKDERRAHHHHHHRHHHHGHQQKYKMLDEEDMCVVCHKEKATMTFNPCRHRNSCHNCSPKLTKCPKCSEFIMYRERQLRS